MMLPHGNIWTWWCRQCFIGFKHLRGLTCLFFEWFGRPSVNLAHETLPRGRRFQQLNFNHRLSQAHMTVEWAFGCLKGCRLCLLKRIWCPYSFRKLSAFFVLRNYHEVDIETFFERDYRVTEEEEGQGLEHHEWGIAEQQHNDKKCTV